MSPEFEYSTECLHVHFRHQCSNGPVQATLPMGPVKWQVSSVEPLTVVPSIQCAKCGLHGFIRDGVWTAV